MSSFTFCMLQEDCGSIILPWAQVHCCYRIYLATYLLQRGSRLVLSIHVDRGSLSTNHEFGFTNSSYADVSTAGLQSS